MGRDEEGHGVESCAGVTLSVNFRVLGFRGPGKTDGRSVRCSSCGCVLEAAARCALTLLLHAEAPSRLSLPFATGRNPK